MTLALRSIHTYPVKSARGHSHDSSAIEPMGLAGDRRWLIVDADGIFLSQREEPRLATLIAETRGHGLRLKAPGLEAIDADIPPEAKRRAVTVWRDTVDAAVAPDAVNAALSRWLARPVALVKFDDRARRKVSADWTDAEVPVGFADGFPVLVTTTETLDALNERMVEIGGDALPMDRFRPNLVIEGSESFAEHGWASIEIAGVRLDLVKPCARCIITTTDQQSGQRMGNEPLATLARTQRSLDRRAPGAIFGWNAIAVGSGVLRVGDAARVVECREPPWPIG